MLQDLNFVIAAIVCWGLFVVFPQFGEQKSKKQT